MHLDIWSPGNVLNEHENGGKVLNCMCDLTQFIVFCMLIDTRAKALSYFFMEQAVLTFGMVVVMVEDTDSNF